MIFIDEYEIIPINDEEKILINLLTGAADLISVQIEKAIINKKQKMLSTEIINTMLERRYIFNNRKEKDEFEKSLTNQLNNLELKEPPNFLIIPTYKCNLKCSYCFEGNYDINSNISSDRSIIDSMFIAINEVCTKQEIINSKDIIITLMGGEPLLAENKDLIIYILENIKKQNYSFNVVTNGYELENYIEILSNFNVDSIQVTIDGPRQIHNLRRVGKNGEPTFDKIFNNVKKCINKKIKTYLRVNVDSSNIDYLPQLATEIKANFNDNEYLNPYIYFLQDGGCSGNKNIIDEINSLKKFIKLEKRYSIIKVFRKSFHGVNFIESILNNTVFKPGLRNCAANKNQYIFDCNGYVYKCWFGIGNENFKIGSFIPTLDIISEEKDKWINRSITMIEKCNICKYRYICSGGCAVRANVNYHSINEGNCADFSEIFRTVLPYEIARKII